MSVLMVPCEPEAAECTFLEPYGGLSKSGGEWGVNLKTPEWGESAFHIV